MGASTPTQFRRLSDFSQRRTHTKGYLEHEIVPSGNKVGGRGGPGVRRTSFPVNEILVTDLSYSCLATLPIKCCHISDMSAGPNDYLAIENYW